MMEDERTLLLTGEDVASLLPLDDCIGAVEAAFRLLGEGKASPPSSLGLHTDNGGFHVKAGVLDLKHSYFAAKVNANFPRNRTQFGLPTIQGIIALFDATNGKRLAVMDSVVVTAIRTGAATAVAAKYLARKDASVVTICGCGVQGRVQLRSLGRVRRLQRVFAFDTDTEQSRAFAQEMEQELRIPISVVGEAGIGTRQSDICVTCTTSKSPIVGPAEIAPGTLVAAVGADNPEKQELDPALFRDSKVVADLLVQCIMMGDLHHAIDAGVITEAEVHAELGEIVAGTKPGRESDDEIILFDSTGLALQDVAAAAIVYERAAEHGCGMYLDFSGKRQSSVDTGRSSSRIAG